MRGDEQKPHTRPSLRGELAHDDKALWFSRHGKCGACAWNVRVLTWGDLHRVRCDWMMTKPGSVQPGYQDPAPWRAARCVSKKEAANVMQAYSATHSNAGRDEAEVSRRHSSWPGVGPMKG